MLFTACGHRGHFKKDRSEREIRAKFERETPNLDTLARQIETRMSTGHDRFQKAPDYAAEFYNILDDEQKADVRKFVLDRLKHL